MCTMMLCPYFYSSCEEYNEGPFAYYDWDKEEWQVLTEFSCKQDCNFCKNCHCDAGGNLVPGENCTQKEC